MTTPRETADSRSHADELGDDRRADLGYRPVDADNHSSEPHAPDCPADAAYLDEVTRRRVMLDNVSELNARR